MPLLLELIRHGHQHVLSFLFSNIGAIRKISLSQQEALCKTQPTTELPFQGVAVIGLGDLNVETVTTNFGRDRSTPGRRLARLAKHFGFCVASSSICESSPGGRISRGNHYLPACQGLRSTSVQKWQLPHQYLCFLCLEALLGYFWTKLTLSQGQSRVGGYFKPFAVNCFWIRCKCVNGGNCGTQPKQNRQTISSILSATRGALRKRSVGRQVL